MLILSVFMFFAFGSFHLSKFVTADEHYWVYERIPQYWQAIKEGKYKKTLINDKPGITVALISGTGLLFDIDPKQHITKIDNNLEIYDTNKSEKIYFSHRLPIIIFNGLFLFFLFWIIKKISNQWIALWSVFFIGFSPILLGISQIINPDSFLWIFSTGAIFSYLALLKYNELKYVILTALFTGLAILSKYTANILFPFYILLLTTYYIIENNDDSKENAYKYFKSNITNYFFITLGSVLTISIFLPAVLVKPVYIYRLTIGLPGMAMFWWLIFGSLIFLLLDTFLLKNIILFNIRKFFRKNFFIFRFFPLLVMAIFFILIIGRNFNPGWQLFTAVPFDAKNISDIKIYNYFPNFLEKIFLEFSPFVFSLTPLTLLLVFYAWIKQTSKKSNEFIFYIFSFTFFILIYYLVSIKSDVLATIRYSIVLYPLFGFIASIGLYKLIGRFSKYNIPISILIMIISLGSLFLAKPFYFNYTNSLLSKNQSVTDAWGYGGYEAAKFLNSLPNPENTIIWTDYYGVCEFFKGKCLTDYKFDQSKYPVEYYILTRRGKIRYEPNYYRLIEEPNVIKALSYYSQKNPIWELDIDNRTQNYIKIFKAE